MNRLRSFLALAILALALSARAQTASPTVIPFQGRLTDQAGTPYTAGQYTLTFNLYNEAVGGTTVWTERHEKVGVINGSVNVFLGSIQSITAVDFSSVKYLGITIDADSNPLTADPEMVPRQMIIPAFWAKRAEQMTYKNAGGEIRAAGWDAVFTGGNPETGTINGGQVASGSVATAQLKDGAVTSAKLSADAATPPGTVVAFFGDTAPVGWLLCDGAEVNRGGIYANLAAVLGNRAGVASDPINKFKLPDLRGYFLRGFDGTAGRDEEKAGRTAMATGGATGNAIGSVQDDSFESHDHGDGNHAHAHAGGPAADTGAGRFTPYGTSTGYGFNLSGVGWIGLAGGSTVEVASIGIQNSGRIIEFRGGAETRPKNAYVNYIIKY